MKLIHCSDIHLDSPMESNLSPRQARQRGDELCATFSRLARYAAEQNVRAVLIAGDLFDSERVSARTLQFILDVIQNTPAVDFLYLRGNHDEHTGLLSGAVLPENLRLFSHDWTSYSYDNVTISGLEWTPENAYSAYDSLHLDPEQTNLVTLHGQVSAQPGPELVCLPLLRGKHIDYLALGHIHSYCEKPLDPDSVWCYCGCLEGRGFDECGSKGFVLLDIQEKQIRRFFVPFARRTLYDLPVDITGLHTVSQIRQAMADASAGLSGDSLVKFTLTGSYTLETQKDLPFLTQLMEPSFYFVKIKDESHLEIQKESYENDISLKGEFIRTVMASSLSQEEKDRIICAGIQALCGEAITL